MRQLVLLLFLFIFSPCIRAQGLSVSSVDSTASVCYNDGSITIHPTGGTPLYTYTIISGPAVANVTYPISGGNDNTFADLHAGTYVVQVTDAVGHTVDVTVTVPGNYQFPQESLSVNGDTIFSSGSLGKPPYTYAISDSSLNGPFGSPQASNAFPNLCNGTYYIRVYDACQNFFTESITVSSPSLSLSGFCQGNGTLSNTVYGDVNGSGNPPYSFRLVNGSYTSSNATGIFNVPTTYPCPDTIYVSDFCHANSKTVVDCYPLDLTYYCFNPTDSTATLTVNGGTPPLTYIFYKYVNNVPVATVTQDSGNFYHLPVTSVNETVGFGVTDACGRTIGPFSIAPLKISAVAACPFNDTIIVTVSGALPSGPLEGGSITCLNCSPAQTDSLPTGIFVVPDTGTYTFRAIDGCGRVKDTTFHAPNQNITGKVDYISCNGVQILASSATGVPITAGVEYILYLLNPNTGAYDSVTENSTGLFVHLPNGTYSVNIIPPSCQPATVTFFVPFFDGYCTTPFFDDNCNIRLIVQYGSPSTDLPENYSLKSSTGFIYNEDPQGGGNGIFFNIPPGNYTLISDSGCSVSQQFTFNYKLAATHTQSCLNAGSVTLFPQNPYYYYCYNSRFIYVLHNADTTLTDTSLFSSSVTFTAVPPGTYLASAYFLSDSVFMADTLVSNGNPHCVLDTLTVRVPQYAEPIISAKNVNVCGANSLGDIPFTIIGGFPPYIVSIFGQATTTTSSNTGVLNNIKPDSTYTIRVSDSCGISSTYSVSVIDTCNLNNCSFVSGNFTVSDSSACSGQTLSFQNDFTAGTTYQWTANGTVFSTGVNPAYQTNATGNIVFKCVVTFGTHCQDSSSITIRVDKTPVFNLGSDTAYCGNFTRVLSTGVYNTHWSTGATDSVITVSAADTYRATVSNACGNFADSVIITQNPVPVVQLVADTTVCTGDSAVLNAFFPSSVYQWSNASTTSSITVTQTGLYIVTVTLQTCQVIDSTHFSAITVVASQLLPADTTLCSGTPLILKPTTGINAVWQDGTHDSIYNVTHSGTYSVTVLTVCGTLTDSTIVVEHTTPVVNLGHDSLLCNGDSIELNAYFPNSTYKWSTGSTADSINVSAQATYTVTVNSFGCIAIDSVVFETATVSHNILPADTTICEGTEVILTPKAGTNPVWQDGSHSPSYTVTVSGLYTVSIATICGEYYDSVNVVVDVCPSNLHVPDAFTPNGDGVNDYFTVYGESIEDYEIKIFDRWGEKVYDSRDVTELNSLSRGWDGTYKGKLQDPATFAYIITAKGYDGKDYFKKGYVILIR
jgi:gliding motility-associated-like protein